MSFLFASNNATLGAAAAAVTAPTLDKLSSTPFYFTPTNSVLPFISDKLLSLLAPVVIYWVVSLLYHALDTMQLPFTEQYRLHEPEEITKRNRVSVPRVIVMVLVQQFFQTLVGLVVLEDEQTVVAQTFADHGARILSIAWSIRHYVAKLVGAQLAPTFVRLLTGSRDANQAAWWLYWWGIPIAQFWFAFFIMDAWQYMLHRAFHESRWLYRNFHSHHHRLYVPYAFGALYNHPVEGLLLDSAGGALSHALALMTVRQGIVLFTFSTLKTVADHGGYAFPWYLDPLHLVFPNNAEYHDVHHQMTGLKYNYSQPFFVHFDALFGTKMSAKKFRELREGAEKRRRDKVETVAPAQPSPSSEAYQQQQQQGAAGEVDLKPSEILAREADPLVTTDQASYHAKAGTSVD
ncbi:Sphingolipid C4-hydroxylase sur2 [Thecaphora frezii]